jgi:uncharacterized membrane protein
LYHSQARAAVTPGSPIARTVSDHRNNPTSSSGPPAAKAPAVSFFDDFRRFFLRGLATLLPTLITVLLLFKLWEILWSYLGRHIITMLKFFHAKLIGDHPHPLAIVRWFWDWHLSPWQVELLGVLLAIILVYIVGLFVGNFLGRSISRLLEVALMRIPLIRAIYPAVKQVTDFVLAPRKSSHLEGSRVVAVQPHADGIWSIGLVTGPGLRALSESVGTDMVTVFVPSSPTAFSGYVLVVPRDRVVELPLTVEEAMRLLVSGGVINPAEAKAAAIVEKPSPALPAGGHPSLPGQPG